MSCFVDNPKISYRRMKMCHLFADTLAELFEMADKIQIDRKHFQISNSGIPHFDICLSKRKLTVSLGALELSSKECVRRCQ